MYVNMSLDVLHMMSQHFLGKLSSYTPLIYVPHFVMSLNTEKVQFSKLLYILLLKLSNCNQLKSS